jgi:hypothetical protein
MELILIGYCALTVALLVVHLADYFLQSPRRQFARRENAGFTQSPTHRSAEPSPEVSQHFDRAA